MLSIKNFSVVALLVVVVIVNGCGSVKNESILTAQMGNKYINVEARYSKSDTSYNVVAETLGEKGYSTYAGLKANEAQAILDTLNTEQDYPYIPFLPALKGQKIYTQWGKLVMGPCSHGKYRDYNVWSKNNTHFLHYKYYDGFYKVSFAGASAYYATLQFTEQIKKYLDSTAVFQSNYYLLVDADGFDNFAKKQDIQNILDNKKSLQGLLKLKFFSDEYADGKAIHIYEVIYKVHPDSAVLNNPQFTSYEDFILYLKKM